ncbi:MAG: hypothetical protein DDT21_02743 [Syntrophomonadaceae bacterium]|nr:hypothetical protein [Bacillota bacterium]
MKQSKYVQLKIPLKDETYLALEYFAALNKESVSALIRRLLAQEMDTSAPEPDVLTLKMRRAIRDTLGPVEEALAKHAADATIAAATGMFLGLWYILVEID